MAEELWYLTTPTGLLKLFTIALGVVTLGIGCHAYLESLWTEVYDILAPLRPYLALSGTTLPDLTVERFFVGIAISCCIISTLYLLAYSLDDELNSLKANRIIDTIYHMVGGILQVVAGSLLIYSACAIESFIDESNKEKYYIPGAIVMPPTRLQLIEEKLSAGILGIINGLLYWIISALVISRGRLHCRVEF